MMEQIKRRGLFLNQHFPRPMYSLVINVAITTNLAKGMYEYCCASVPNRGIHYGSTYIKRILKDDRKTQNIV